MEDPDSFIAFGRYDWFVTRTWNRLHAVPEFSEAHRECIKLNWSVKGPVRLACGRSAAELHIPGMFTRMGAQRCTGCCRAMGFPPGKGSPKNDAECRKILGLPPGGEAPPCTCALGAGKCGPEGCHCSTSIMECAVHRDTPLAQAERAGVTAREKHAER